MWVLAGAEQQLCPLLSPEPNGERNRQHKKAARSRTKDDEGACLMTTCVPHSCCCQHKTPLPQHTTRGHGLKQHIPLSRKCTVWMQAAQPRSWGISCARAACMPLIGKYTMLPPALPPLTQTARHMRRRPADSLAGTRPGTPIRAANRTKELKRRPSRPACAQPAQKQGALPQLQRQLGRASVIAAAVGLLLQQLHSCPNLAACHGTRGTAAVVTATWKVLPTIPAALATSSRPLPQSPAAAQSKLIQ